MLDKKVYVEKYLGIFTKGVSNKWGGKLAYVDLFSGPGKNVIRETGEEVEGSPLLALQCDFDVTSLLMCRRSLRRCD